MADGMSGDQEFLADEVKIIMKDVSPCSSTISQYLRLL